MDLTIVIVNYNVRYFLEQCLLSVHAAIEGINAEVYVVDNRSSDGSVEMVQEKFPWVHVIANKENVGFSKANNQAMLLAKGRYVLLLNPDTVVEENTFQSCIEHMDAHPQAGGLGVKMVDGRGNFLPESKRGLPTPAVAFYKMFGLSTLFPKSKTFGQYHLSFLDEERVHDVDILAGAYMFMRKSVLDQIGLLDEAFFMYGEDIDLSWRIRLAGYSNVYFPKTRIIHYKGESTKKSSVNYVFVFYNAMIIFARKHFSKSRAGILSILIHLAIYLRAGVAILRRVLSALAVPTLDGLLTLGTLVVTTLIYNDVSGIAIPNAILKWALPSYAVLLALSFYFSGVYDKPVRIQKLWRGLLTGALTVLLAYALLPESVRFSRAIVLGSIIPIAALIIGMRYFLYKIGKADYQMLFGNQKRLAVVGSPDEIERTTQLIKEAGQAIDVLVHVSNEQLVSPGNHTFVAGLGQLKEAVETFRLNEVVFSGASLSPQQIISQMSYINNPNLEYKIAPKASAFIIGSNSIHATGDLYHIDNLSTIHTPSNRRNKRLVDILVSLLLISIFPLIIVLNKGKLHPLKSLLGSLFGTRTMVGYYPVKDQKYILPKLPKPNLFILNIESIDNNNLEKAKKANLNYARNYHVGLDLKLIFKNLKRFRP